MSVLIIAEPGMTWDRKLEDAYRLIDAAKACGADVCKFQWTSSGRKIQERRKVDPKYVAIYERGVQYPREWLELLKAHCDRVGIEFACTTYLPGDVWIVDPLVKRHKISAYESQYEELCKTVYATGKLAIISCNPNAPYPPSQRCDTLHCISEYPAPLEHMKLSEIRRYEHAGISDHSANVLTGCAAVAAGAQIIEAHIRLSSTLPTNPDYPHSLVADTENPEFGFSKYVSNIRTVERML